MTKRLMVVVIVLLASTDAGKISNSQSVITIQSSLDSALDDDSPIVLTESSNFLAPPGTIIFLSRELGMRRMIALARAGEPELSMLFLPHWEAWITETVSREMNTSRIDLRYATAALVAGLETELWHTHNNVGQKLESDEKRRVRSIQWVMPSSEDLLQLYEFAREIPNGKLRGVIANIHGATTYWNDDPSWAQAIYLRFALRNEAAKLNREASKLSVEELQTFALRHKGFVRLRFEQVAAEKASSSEK